MRKLILVAVALLAIGSIAIAAVTGKQLTATMGPTNSSGYVAVATDVDNSVYIYTDKVFVDQSTYGAGQGVSFKAVTTCGCKTFANGLCIEKGTCS